MLNLSKNLQLLSDTFCFQTDLLLAHLQRVCWCNYTQVPTFSIQPRPRTGPEGSRRCCWPAACQTFLEKRKGKINVQLFFFLNELHQNLVLSKTLIKLHKLLDILTDQVDFAIALYVVKGCIDSGGFAVQHCKPAPIGLPGEGDDALCDKQEALHSCFRVPPKSQNASTPSTVQTRINKFPCSRKTCFIKVPSSEMGLLLKGGKKMETGEHGSVSVYHQTFIYIKKKHREPSWFSPHCFKTELNYMRSACLAYPKACNLSSLKFRFSIPFSVHKNIFSCQLPICYRCSKTEERKSNQYTGEFL